MVSARSIATLVVFIISIIFVIQPVHLPIPRRIPYFGRQKMKIPVNLTTAPIVAIAILWAAQCIDSTVIRDGIVGTEGVKPYNILILFFSLAYMSITLDITGILQSAAYWVSNRGGGSGRKLFFYFYLMLTLVSVVIGNDPVILSGTAFLVYYTGVIENREPLPWLISEFAAANTASMVLFVGNPTNVVICEGFGVNNAAFTAYTILPFLACSVACYIALLVQYRDQKYIPRQVEATKLDVRSVLQDSVSACVGSIWLVACLVIIIVVGFFNIDVWMISLPFALIKFIYDLGWDHYRYRVKRRTLGKGQSEPEKIFSKQSSSPTALTDISPTATVQNPSQRRVTPRSTDDTLVDMDPILTPNHTIESKLYTPPEHSTVGVTQHTPTEPLSPEPLSPENLTPEHPPPQPLPSKEEKSPSPTVLSILPTRIIARLPTTHLLTEHFDTFFTALPRLPFALVPFAFSQFILIEALTHQGWIDVFAGWLVRATNFQIYPTIWLIGVLGVLLCNLSGTNIGATILLTKVVRAAGMPPHTLRAAAIALAVASNIGAVSFTFSASLAGLLWKTILNQKKISCKQWEFAKWNALPLIAMTAIGLSVVSAEMAVLYGAKVS